jgi:hypothetical protein
MPKVLLEINNSGKVYAPSFCPYKEPEVREEYINTSIYPERNLPGVKLVPTERFLVRPGLCCICKTCTFVPDIEGLPLSSPTQEEKDAFQEYLAHTNLKTSASLSGQQQYLLKQDRLPISIFISRDLYDDMTKEVILDEQRRQSLLGYFLNEEIVICHVLGCPVYLSKKLTKSNIQVVGEVEWK